MGPEGQKPELRACPAWGLPVRANMRDSDSTILLLNSLLFQYNAQHSIKTNQIPEETGQCAWKPREARNSGNRPTGNPKTEAPDTDLRITTGTTELSKAAGSGDY